MARSMTEASCLCRKERELWEEAVDRIRRGFANPDVEQVTDTADAMTFYSKKRGTYQLKNTADGLKMTILTKPSSSKKEHRICGVQQRSAVAGDRHPVS